MTDKAIPLSSQDITPAEIDAVVDVLRSERLSLGPQVVAFEQALADRAGRKFGIAVNSGTSALHLCVRSLGLTEGDEVITTPFSFIATTNCILFERAKPVLVDIDPDTYNMDPDAAAAAINDRTRCLLPVEAFGNAAHFDRYETLAADRGLSMIEDSCEALGAHCGSRPAGSFGDCSTFAFYPNKQITTGEGGMVVTDREDIRDLCRSLRNQGRGTDAWLCHARLGYNYRMSELTAALGVVQMHRLDEILAKRRRAAENYTAALADIPEIHLPDSGSEQTSWFVYVIRLADEFTAAQRDALLAHLTAAGIGCNNYFVPIHLQPYIMDLLGTRAGAFPVTERVAARTVALPFFANLSESQIGRVADAMREAITAVR